MYENYYKSLLFLALFTCTDAPIQSFNRNYMSDQNSYSVSATTIAQKIGSLIVICGAMCCGKTEELIRIISRQIIADETKVQAFKPLLDNRKLSNNDSDPSRHITSRNGSSIKCIAVHTVDEIRQYVIAHNISIIAIDEAQFFNKEEFIEFTHEMVALGKKVIIAGLDLDFRAEPFGPMGDLLAYADNVIKLTAICKKCGQDTYCISQRLIDNEPAHYNDPIVMVGESQYEPRCRQCHIIRKD